MTETQPRPTTVAEPVPGAGSSPAPALLIEDWLPIAELGAEAQREGSAAIHPPVNRLHVWWARRPLTVSRAAILASLLPAWSPAWPPHLRHRFPDRERYHAWFRELLGIRGDPVAARKLIQAANARGIRLRASPYEGDRAFTINPEPDDLALMLDLLEATWGTRELSILDPMAGGGSIPFEALRFGMTTYANELNPVASVILAATLDYPARFGEAFSATLRQWGARLIAEVEKRVPNLYPVDLHGRIFAYLWARTVACPTTGKPVPLSPNWWLQKGRDPIAARLICEPDAPACRFEIVRGEAALRSNPDAGTIRRGVAISPWTGETIPGETIKREAQAGRMGSQLYAVGVKTASGTAFRPPREADLAAVAAAEAELARRLPDWLARGIIPDEEIPFGNKTAEPHRYGMTRWRDLFAPRQLLALGACAEALHELAPAIDRALPPDQARAVLTYLALAIDKMADYNSRMSRLDVTRGAIKNTFDRHDFSMKWSHGEMALVVAGKGLEWALDQVADAYQGIARLAQPARFPLWQAVGPSPVARLHVTQGDATDLREIAPGAVHLVCVDPPYYDNVQYSELSDFFYVWLKRTVGDRYPGWFAAALTDKDDEAVANPARFADFGRKAKLLATDDYERKMTAVFRELHRVLRPDGVLTVMFTHKRVEAWDTLAAALIGAGFRIEASWPVHTESEHSLHQAKKNAAASTILLVCRKRTPSPAPVWWDDLRGEVRRVARERAEHFAALGIGGADLYISAFGPALSVISARWPVLTSEVDPKTGQPKVLRPEVALDLARAEVIGLRRQGLLLGQQVQFDPVTDWYLLAWDAFKAAEFPADEARKLALALGLDLEQEIVRARLVEKKQSTVVMQEPRARRRAGVVDPEAPTFRTWLDAVHTAMLVYEEDGSRACEHFLQGAGLLTNATFTACLQAFLNAIPRTRLKGEFVRPEAATLDRLRDAFFPALTVPAEDVPLLVEQQIGLSLPGDGGVPGEGDDADDDDEEA